MTTVFINERTKGDVDPVLINIDTPEKWWAFLLILWRRFGNYSPSVNDPQDRPFAYYANLDIHAFGKCSKAFALDGRNESRHPIKLRDVQRKLANSHPGDIMIVTVDGSTEVIVHPEKLAGGLGRADQFLHRLPPNGGRQILRSMFIDDDYVITSQRMTSAFVLISDLTSSHVYISGVSDKVPFRILCDRASCPTRLGVTYTTETDSSKSTR